MGQTIADLKARLRRVSTYIIQMEGDLKPVVLMGLKNEKEQLERQIEKLKADMDKDVEIRHG